MPQYEVIRDIGVSLLALLEGELKKQKIKAKALLVSPTREHIEKHAPVLSLYLYELRENVPFRDPLEWDMTVRGPDGTLSKVKVPAPLEVSLRWLLTAAADDVALEHTLLALGMKAFLEHPILTNKELKAEHFPVGEEIPLKYDQDFKFENAASVFNALGAPHRPSVAYTTPCRIFTEITIQPAKRVEERDIAVFDKIRPPPGKPTGGGPLSPGDRRFQEIIKQAAGGRKETK